MNNPILNSFIETQVGMKCKNNKREAQNNPKFTNNTIQMIVLGCRSFYLFIKFVLEMNNISQKLY